MANHSGRQTAYERLLLALACGATAEAAARRAGIGETAVYRRLNEPDFMQRLRAVQADILSQASRAREVRRVFCPGGREWIRTPFSHGDRQPRSDYGHG